MTIVETAKRTASCRALRACPKRSIRSAKLKGGPASANSGQPFELEKNIATDSVVCAPEPSNRVWSIQVRQGRVGTQHYLSIRVLE
jgi:hypothetical protein